MQSPFTATESTDFAVFVTARSDRLYRIAYLLTHDRTQAEDLLQTGLMRAWSAWRRIEGDPEPYIRRILVNTYSAWWRRRWNGEVPAADLPEIRAADQHGPVDDRDEMRRALMRLPRQQRAVLVLRYYEELSEAEIAETMGISPGTVKSHTHKALNNLRLDAELVGSANPDRLAQVDARITHRRRRRIAAVGAACAVVIAIIIGYAVAPAHRSAPQPVGPTPSPSPGRLNLGSFAEYEFGSRKATTGRVPPQGELRLMWTWDGRPAYLFLRCHAGRTTSIEVRVRLGDSARPLSLGCTAGPTGDGTLYQVVPADDGSPAGFAPGRPAQLTASLSRVVQGGLDVALSPDSWVEMAVGVTVDWADYSFPPRPAVLVSPSAPRWSGEPQLRSDPADPTRPRSIDLVWDEDILLSAYQPSPGLLHVAVNGIELHTFAQWDYVPAGSAYATGYGTQGPYGRLPAKGSHVTLTVTPEHVTDPWGIWINP